MTSHPPRPIPALCIGITGHRRLEGVGIEQLRLRLADLMTALAGAAREASKAPCYASGATHLTLLSQLASGVDQMAAETALEAGYGLRAVLPFAPSEFVADFETEALDRFHVLLNQCESAWSLPGDRAEGGLAYALAGEATAAQCDILIAVWDGDPARGPGGTADVVDYAVRRGVPVLLVPPDRGDTALLWSALHDLPPNLFHRDNVPRKPASAEVIATLVGALMLPAGEQALLTTYQDEPERRWRLRLEYPLLLALAGIRRITAGHIHVPPYVDRIREEWAALGEVPAGYDRLEQAYAWADGLADHFAQLYRSGTVFNFAAAALAVLLALLGFVLPGAKLWLVAGELALIAGLILNTSLGRRRQWHRRWLDYRVLAEHLRTFRSLRLTSLAGPSFVAGAGNDEQRWMHWYAAAAWRALGTPPSIPDNQALEALADRWVCYEVEGQIAYHKASAHRMHLLDHRLHRVGGLLFALTGAIGMTLLAGHMLDLALVRVAFKWLSVLAAALPTCGSALFGIRGAGDFAGAAARSERTAARLGQLASRLRVRPLGLPDAARAMEEVAATMIRDLGEWRTTYSTRDLAIPA